MLCKGDKVTAFFDDLAHEVEAIQETGDDFLQQVEMIEDGAIHIVSTVTGDREFPEDEREYIQGVIARYKVSPIGNVYNKRLRNAVEADHVSMLIEGIHSAFHALASRRIECRFGRLTDCPRDILTRRDDHDGTDLVEELRKHFGHAVEDSR